jgi:CheY-like chemotaxis protein
VHRFGLVAASPCSKTILVVDDETDILAAIADVLTHEGYTVATATNGRDGLDRLAEIGRPCLVLLDIMMPWMRGYEVLARLRADPLGQTIPVAVMTATRQPQPEGTTGLLLKPFQLADLLSIVEAHCPREKTRAG